MSERAPDSSAVRVALWRALHVQIDSPPHVLEDEVGLRLANPDEGWRARPDMNPRRTSRARASIVARARFIDDLVVERAGQGVGQYVLLGAGLDTFAQRRADVTSKLHVFEVDRAGAQEWKRDRLVALGYGVPGWLHLVGVDFEKESWWERLASAGFDASRPAVVASTGVSMYLTREANRTTLAQLAKLARGSSVAMSFMVPSDLVDAEERPAREATEKGARASGTPMLSFFTPEEMLALARDAGFRDVQHVSSRELDSRYFSARTDGLRPSSSEELLVAAT